MSERTEAIERVLVGIEDIRAGKMVVVVDDEDRENEGDLVMAADLVTPEAVNFMAKYARGLICLPLEAEQIDRLGLPMMVDANRAQRETAFTVSIEARTGVTTGISAADRARTIKVAVDPATRASDIVSPGHVFPLRAQPGGVLQRTGHTEGSVDLARLAGLTPAAVICEIMNDDGTMARYPELERFAAEHGLHMMSIADLVEYRISRESLMACVSEQTVTLRSGKTWEAKAFRARSDEREFLALSYGRISTSPTLVRVHTCSVVGDTLGLNLSAGRFGLDDAIARIEAEGSGVILLVPGRESFSTAIARLTGSVKGAAEGEARDSGEVLREYGLGAQVLSQLGLHQIRLLTSRPRRIPNLEAYGLKVVDQLAVGEPT